MRKVPPDRQPSYDNRNVMILACRLIIGNQFPGEMYTKNKVLKKELVLWRKVSVRLGWNIFTNF